MLAVCTGVRYKEQNTTRVPVAKMVYFSLIDWLRLFWACPPVVDTATAYVRPWYAHGPGAGRAEECLTDIFDGSTFGHLRRDHPDFFSSCYNLCLMLAADGYLAFGKRPPRQADPEAQRGAGQSIWPITVTITNLPPWIRTKPGALLLVALPDMEHFHDLSPWLEPLIDELNLLWQGVDMGVRVNMPAGEAPVSSSSSSSSADGAAEGDARPVQTLKVRAVLLHMVADYPGLAKLLSRCAQQYASIAQYCNPTVLMAAASHACMPSLDPCLLGCYSSATAQCSYWGSARVGGVLG
jgi:hypothetical protein